MKAGLVKVDPKEYGLEKEKVKSIEEAFLPKITERNGLAEIYKDLITKEINEQTCKEAGNLRRKLVKVRTGIASIHKTQKAFYLASGKYVDAWKNKETEPIEQMEEKLSEIEKYFEKLEQERINKLSESRANEIKPFLRDDALEPLDLGYMADDVWETYLLGAKSSYEARIKAEKEAEELRIQAEKKAEAERIAKEKAEEEERERIRLENERLKKEAKERELLAKIEAEKRAKEEAERKTKEAAERKVREEKERKEKEVYEAKLKAEREAREKVESEEKAKREKLEAELKAKEEAEIKERELLAKIEAEKKEAERLATLAPEKEKISKWIDSMTITGIGTEGFSKEGIEVCNLIFEKFNSFKKWAESQKDSIK